MSLLEIVRPAPHVAELWLNRPETRNAFNAELIAELAAAFRGLGAEPGLRALVLGGRGKAFCAGADLNWMRTLGSNTWQQNKADAQALADMLWLAHTCPLPIVGRLHGDCYAGGVGLAAVCDVRIAAEGMHFCLSEARLGLLPATIGPYVLRALGEPASRRYFVTAERFSAARALALGFVHEVTAPAALDAQVAEIVAALVANGPQAVRASKQLVLDLAGREIDAALREDTARRIADTRAGDEGREGMSSFLDKREPAWKCPR